jgi:hypothetical protein
VADGTVVPREGEGASYGGLAGARRAVQFERERIGIVVRKKRVRRGGTAGSLTASLLLISLVLASCGVDAQTSPVTHSTVVTPTGYLAPTSICASGANFLTQRLNGDLSGCFRVPALGARSLVVAIQTYLLDSTTSRPSMTTTTFPSTPGSRLTLTVRPSHVTPGERVTVTGHYAGAPAEPRNSHVNLCWDGCKSGLVENGVPIHWTSPSTFRATLQVPATAWLDSGIDGVGVHELSAGSYRVGVQCLGAISGCALGSADAQTMVHLSAPPPRRCVAGQPCATLHLSPSTATVGDMVQVRGWAPLESIIGVPFGFQLSVAGANKGVSYPNLSFQRLSTSGGYNAVLAPTPLHVDEGPSWSTLGQLGYDASSFDGPALISAAEGSSRVAWCLPTGLVISGAGANVSVSTAAAAGALAGTKLTIFGSSTSSPPCASVLVDPDHPNSVFAGFDTAEDGSAPPIYIAGLFSTDDGTQWQRVPVPPGASLESFGGFVESGRSVEALFSPSQQYGDVNAPLGTTSGRVRTEVTTNGGASWVATSLGCLTSGPCSTFGPYETGNCGMVGNSQSLLVGPRHSTATFGIRWRYSSWVSTLNSCFTQQLVTTSARDLALLDPSSQYPLLRSTDGGANWSDVVLPTNDGCQFRKQRAARRVAPHGARPVALRDRDLAIGHEPKASASLSGRDQLVRRVPVRGHRSDRHGHRDAGRRSGPVDDPNPL